MTQREMNKLVKKFNESMEAGKHKLRIAKASVKDLRIDFVEKKRMNVAKEGEPKKIRYVNEKSHFDFAAVENMVNYLNQHTLMG